MTPSMFSLALQVLCLASLPGTTTLHVIAESSRQDLNLNEATNLNRRVEYRYLVPDHPFKDQKTPPCDRDLRESELNGGCWQKVDRTAPCGPKLFEHQGSCYRWIKRAERPPNTIHSGDGVTPADNDISADGGPPGVNP